MAHRAWLAGVALTVVAACAHAPARPTAPVAREDRATTIVRRWSRNEATAEEVDELVPRFMSLPAPVLAEALQALQAVGHPQHLDDAFTCRRDEGAGAPLECGIDTGGGLSGLSAQAGLGCWYVTGGVRCDAQVLSCRQIGTGTEGVRCDDHDVCFAPASGGVSVHSGRGVRVVRAERLPEIPHSLRCPSAER